MQEDDVDICASPELDLNSGKPVFEDVDEFRDIQDNDLLDNSDDWGFKSNQETNRVQGWGFKSNQETDGLGFRVYGLGFQM